MGKNTSISLGNHFESFIKKEVNSGRYQSASEVVRSALRLLESEKQKIIEIKQALDNGETSGCVDNFNSEDHLQKLHRKLS